MNIVILVSPLSCALGLQAPNPSLFKFYLNPQCQYIKFNSTVFVNLYHMSWSIAIISYQYRDMYLIVTWGYHYY